MAYIGFMEDDKFICNYEAPLYECKKYLESFKKKDKRNTIWL